MPTIAAATQLVRSMERRLDDLFVQTEQLSEPEAQRELERQAEQAESNTEQIEEWGQDVLASGRQAEPSIGRKWRDLRSKSELLERRLRLWRPRSAPEFESTQLWVAERGELEDLVMLRLIKKNPPYTSAYIRSLQDTAERRIIERYEHLSLELREFFGISRQEFARLLNLDGALQDIQVARQAQLTIESLDDLKKLLEMQFEDKEIKRWLRTPNAKFDGTPPVNLIARGETDRISHLLTRLAEGIHY
jgi:hypothetical protein